MLILIGGSFSLICSISMRYHLSKRSPSCFYCFAEFGHVIIHVKFAIEPQPSSSGSGCGFNGESTIPLSDNSDIVCNASAYESIWSIRFISVFTSTPSKLSPAAMCVLPIIYSTCIIFPICSGVTQMCFQTNGKYIKSHLQTHLCIY